MLVYQLDMILQGLAGDGPVRDYTQSRWGRKNCDDGAGWCGWGWRMHRFCQYWGLGVYCHSIKHRKTIGKP